MKPLLLAFAVWLSVSALAWAQPKPQCQVEKGRVGTILLGRPIQQLSALKTDFLISEVNHPPMVRTFRVTEKRSKRLWFEFSVDNHDRIIIAAVHGPCKTKEGIGVGSTLGEARQVYGAPQVSPSDSGYFIAFERLPGIAFLLRNEDIPTALRDIPDDALKDKEAKAILQQAKARIVALEMSEE